MHLVFENSTSPLYRSNDGVLSVVTVPGDGEITYTVVRDGDVVFATHDRVKADAFIAGYDLAQTEVDHPF